MIDMLVSHVPYAIEAVTDNHCRKQISQLLSWNCPHFLLESMLAESQSDIQIGIKT